MFVCMCECVCARVCVCVCVTRGLFFKLNKFYLRIFIQSHPKVKEPTYLKFTRSSLDISTWCNVICLVLILNSGHRVHLLLW